MRQMIKFFPMIATSDLVRLLHNAECLNTHWFLSLPDARRKLEDWRRDYNEVRPHGAIGDKTPVTLHFGADEPCQAAPKRRRKI